MIFALTDTDKRIEIPEEALAVLEKNGTVERDRTRAMHYLLEEGFVERFVYNEKENSLDDGEQWVALFDTDDVDRKKQSLTAYAHFSWATQGGPHVSIFKGFWLIDQYGTRPTIDYRRGN